MLTASDLWFGYDDTTPVLRGVSLTVPADGIVGILGPNGSGKTTLLRLLAGTRRPQRGEVTIDGAPLARFSRTALARRMAVVPQETQLAFDYTVAEVAMMGRYPHLGAFEIEGPSDVAVIEETLASTGTLHLKDRSFATLSGGEKQRVVIAAALAQIFRVQAEETGGYLLLDEPTASLDLGYQLEVADLLTRLHESRRVAIVISTHDLGLAGTLCEQLLLMRDGMVMAHGATDGVLTPENVRRAYGVEADIMRHPSGHRIVVPVRRAAVDASERSDASHANGAGPGAPASARLRRGSGEVSPEALRAKAEACRGVRGAKPLGSNVTLERRFVRTVLAFGALTLITLLAAPLAGPTPVNFRRAFDFSIPFADNVDAQIFFVARLPRTLAGACVGALFAAAGVVFQGLLRNPLATPFTLGVSTGAALGAVLAITFNWSLGFAGISAVPAAAFAGSLVAVGIVYALAQARHRGLSTTVLLLAGVTMNAFFSAMILFVQYFASFADTYRTLRWLMGDLDVSSYEPLVAAVPASLAAFGVFAWLARPLNLLALGADSAESRGLDVAKAQRAAFLSGSLATGAAVSIGGPIGFVGIIIPHLVRLIVGPDHRLVLPAATLFGAAFLVGCDLIARTILAPVELPVGIITALLGGPFFLWLLIRKP